MYQKQWIVFLISLVLVLKQASATITCYDCDSITNPLCMDPFITKAGQIFLRPCPTGTLCCAVCGQKNFFLKHHNFWTIIFRNFLERCFQFGNENNQILFDGLLESGELKSLVSRWMLDRCLQQCYFEHR